MIRRHWKDTSTGRDPTGGLLAPPQCLSDIIFQSGNGCEKFKIMLHLAC